MRTDEGGTAGDERPLPHELQAHYPRVTEESGFEGAIRSRGSTSGSEGELQVSLPNQRTSGIMSGGSSDSARNRFGNRSPHVLARMVHVHRRQELVEDDDGVAETGVRQLLQPVVGDHVARRVTAVARHDDGVRDPSHVFAHRTPEQVEELPVHFVQLAQRALEVGPEVLPEQGIVLEDQGEGRAHLQSVVPAVQVAQRATDLAGGQWHAVPLVLTVFDRPREEGEAVQLVGREQRTVTREADIRQRNVTSRPCGSCCAIHARRSGRRAIVTTYTLSCSRNHSLTVRTVTPSQYRGPIVPASPG